MSTPSSTEHNPKYGNFEKLNKLNNLRWRDDIIGVLIDGGLRSPYRATASQWKYSSRTRSHRRSKGNVELRWSIAHGGHSSGSDHEILVWEVVEEGRGGPTSKVITRWDLREFKRTDGAPVEQERRKKGRAEARRLWGNAAER